MQSLALTTPSQSSSPSPPLLLDFRNSGSVSSRLTSFAWQAKLASVLSLAVAFDRKSGCFPAPFEYSQQRLYEGKLILFQPFFKAIFRGRIIKEFDVILAKWRPLLSRTLCMNLITMLAKVSCLSGFSEKCSLCCKWCFCEWVLSGNWL